MCSNGQFLLSEYLSMDIISSSSIRRTRSSRITLGYSSTSWKRCTTPRIRCTCAGIARASAPCRSTSSARREPSSSYRSPATIPSGMKNTSLSRRASRERPSILYASSPCLYWYCYSLFIDRIDTTFIKWPWIVSHSSSPRRSTKKKKISEELFT